MDPVRATSLEQCVIDLFPAGILVFNPDGSVLTINQSARAVLQGLCDPQLIKSWDDFILFSDIPVKQTEEAVSRNERVIAESAYAFYCTKIPCGDGPVRIVYIADITHEKRLINDIHRMTSSILIGIRTRVTGIQNALGLLLDYNLPPGESAGLVKDSRYEIWLLSRYADNLKELSLSHANAMTDALQLQPLPLFRLVKEAIDNTTIFRSYNNNMTQIKMSIPRDIIVRCDRMRLIKVIESLLLNSLIYAGPDNEIDMSAAPDGTWTVLRIQDRGMGIPLEDQQHIFEYRFRGRNKAKVKYNGMGIELFLAKLNISCQEGTLSFTSKEGAGTGFEIALKRDPAV